MSKQITLEDIAKKAFEDEQKLVRELLAQSNIYQEKSDKIFERAERYVQNIRENADALSVETFLNQYSLDTYEGVAIMCLAEALLRIPDQQTADELIRDKLEKGNWKKFFSKDGGILMNSSTYGLMISGKILQLSKESHQLESALSRIASRIGEPAIREALKKGMQILGQKFVLGTNTENALDRAKKIGKKGYLFSFDMLGEGARTKDQAEKYFNNYLNGVKQISEFYKKDSAKKELYKRQNISVKLSALHPRYELAKKDRVMDELLPKLKEIALSVKDNDIWMAIDAEETWRLEISLMIFEELLKDKDFSSFNGLGFVVQAYGKRALFVIKYLKQLAQKYNKKIPVRLVKGAYWDSEIKAAQINGVENYPVFTRKSHTDLSYLVCAREMLENLDCFYPQFATHNALTVASILEFADYIDNSQFEFQRLYGMGDTFYDNLVEQIPVRIYAPVGSYEELLPYLIRRILENGSNNSFVSLVVDKDEPIGQLLTSPVDKILRAAYTSKKIPLPSEIYLPERINSKGFEVGNLHHKNILEGYLEKDIKKNITAKSIINGHEIDAKPKDIENAIDVASDYFNKWNDFGFETRAKLLENLADNFEENFESLLNILVYEANKKPKDAIGEIREAVDFLRYYAQQARLIEDEDCKGYTGEKSILKHKGKGVFACISPWNFPLAIFIGQIAAALVSGNSVIAKPAEQTSKIAYFAVKLAYQSGVPETALQLVIGKGSVVGKIVTENKKIAGVVFTGSTETAWNINRSLASRNSSIATLIAETGGQNCMIVDSSALLEKAVDDVVESAFGSAGQRCSACRVVYIQDEVADDFIEILKGAVAELEIASANYLSTDIPPVIDAKAKDNLQAHIDEMMVSAKLIYASKAPDMLKESYVAPHVFEIDSLDILHKENFGPILHVIRFKRENIDKIIDEINATNYALTFGIQSRVYEFIYNVYSKINAGNIYINRSIIGAVVGTHPFGGSLLSGTGPKAGGPNYLKRFLNEVTVTDNISAIGGNLELIT